ncbi:MAG: 3-deoxy-manno-octulosonate cytidylyltransferase [Steroidobacteraceae bacterium]
MAFHVVIPARYASTRLPAKPLLEIGGQPMIRLVAERARASGAAQVVVATDDPRIAAAVGGLDGVSSMLTDPELPSGTDRAAAVAAGLGWPEDAIVVNVQGDEPFMPPALIGQVATLLERDARAGIATLATPITSLEAFLDPNVVKVVTAADGAALYFSRAPVPWCRDGAPAGLASQRAYDGAMRHVGIYAYRVATLARVTAIAPSPLERLEKLEQLRALEAGVRIVVAACAVPPGHGVDTEADLARARALATAAMDRGVSR